MQTAADRSDLSLNGHNPADLVICGNDGPHLRLSMSQSQDGSSGMSAIAFCPKMRIANRGDVVLHGHDAGAVPVSPTQFAWLSSGNSSTVEPERLHT
jgi:hypothetical protein